MASKPFITNLRLLMAAGSFLGFVGGWGLLAQAGSLAETTAPAVTVVAEAPVQPTGSVTVSLATATAATTTPTTTTVQATSTPAATATATAKATATPTQTTTTTKPSTSTKMRTGGS